MLLHWLRERRSSPSRQATPTTTPEPDLACLREGGDVGGDTYARCRAQGLEIARTTIAMIADLLTNRRYSRLTLAFTLYAFFHALLVPLIHVKTDPWSSVSISCMQDLEKAKTAIEHLPIDGDAQTRYFALVLRRLFAVAAGINDDSVQSGPDRCTQGPTTVDVHAVKRSNNDIFNGEELALLEAGDLGVVRELYFSEWVHLSSV